MGEAWKYTKYQAASPIFEQVCTNYQAPGSMHNVVGWDYRYAISPGLFTQQEFDLVLVASEK